MTASTLKTLYEAQLQQDLEPPVHEHVDRRATRCMLRISRALPPGELTEGDHNRIWIWSDLHLGHHETIGFFQRPFPSPRQMDLALFSAWERTVAPRDTIICLGDVTIPALWGPRLKRLRRAPGRKLLVIGNHEINGVGEVDIDGFDEIHSTLYASGDPPLLLTHMPLETVPEGSVNVHGHLHDEPSPSREQHINVSVEQLDYRPWPWEAVRTLARRLAAGHRVRRPHDGRTTEQHRLTGGADNHDADSDLAFEPHVMRAAGADNADSCQPPGFAPCGFRAPRP